MQPADGPLYRRWWKVWLFPRCCLPCNPVLGPCRKAVSQNKTRFREDGFDLDLTYVTSRIIVHGFPATGVEHIYRNPRTEVQRLLDKYHKDHYKVYNFANEAGRSYPEQYFQGRVERYPFTDHTCPPLESVVNFCENAKAWLDMDENNVVSLHCKAGKGRAGIMAACLLVRLGNTAREAVSKYDETRVSDLKGLTVVNQRKWPFMYERLVKEVWRVQDSIGMIPGQDPDLTAPTPRAVCIREVSIQLQPPPAGSRKSGSFLPNVSCAIYQQEPLGKKLLHRAKMVEVTPQDGEPELVFAAYLPRSAVVQSTFQVLISASVGTASTQKNVIDLWWNTTFLAADGGSHVFALSEMDLSPPKLAGRLDQANAKVVLRHTHPHAQSPRRRPPLKPLSASNRSAHESGSTVAEGEGASGTGTGTGTGTASGTATGADTGASALPGGEGGTESPPGASDRSLPPDDTAPDTGGRTGVSSNGGKVGGNETVVSATSTAGGDSAGGGVASGREEASASEGAKPDGVVAETGGVSLGDAQRMPASETGNNQDAPVGPSPALPGPSPAGMVSPVWTFEGRTPSSKVGASGRAVGDSQWARSKMWMSNQGMSSGGASTPTRSASLTVLAEDGVLREKRLALQRRRSGSRSMDSFGLSTAAPTGTSSSMRGIVGKAMGSKGKTKTRSVPARGETDSESDDLLAVRASAFQGGGGSGPHGPQARAPTTGPSPSIRGEQWAMEMEMMVAQERRRWEEHQYCLETELDWALAARARAEARSEEDSARVEVLQEQLDVWRSEYSVIERDVKQAVGLLEMSLSGLMSAETAVKRWRDQIPSKAYDDIMGSLTRGEPAPSSSVADKE